VKKRLDRSYAFKQNAHEHQPSMLANSWATGQGNLLTGIVDEKSTKTVNKKREEKGRTACVRRIAFQVDRRWEKGEERPGKRAD